MRPLVPVLEPLDAIRVVAVRGQPPSDIGLLTGRFLAVG